MHEKIDEISKVAAVKASAALSKLIKHPVGVDVSPAVEISDSQLPMPLNSDDLTVTMTIPITGDLNGLAIMSFEVAVALSLCDLMFQKSKGETKNFAEIEKSALIELANIVIGNFLSPFAYPLKLESVMHRTPDFKCDIFSNVRAHVTDVMKLHKGEGAMLEILINLNHAKIKGFIIIMLMAKEINNAIDQATGSM